MTAYNRESFIAEAIKSVQASSFTDFELIIVDDASEDKTAEIVQSFTAMDNRIRLSINEINLGDYPNRNRAASFAKGKYLKYVDSDDRLEPDALQKMVHFMESFPDAGFGLSDPFYDTQEQYPVLLNSYEAYSCHYFKRPVFFASPGLAIFRKDAFESVGGFPEKRMVGDFEMWHKLALKFPLLLMPGNMYWIRKHAGQEVTEQNKYVLAYEKVKVTYLFSGQSPLNSRQACEIVKKRKRTVLKIAMRKLLTLDFRGAGIRLKVYFFYFIHRKQLKVRI